MASLFVLLFGVLNAINAVWGGQTCCPDIGCIGDEPPYNKWVLPECPDVQLTLYTRGGFPEVIDINSFPYNYNGLRRTILFAHGWLETADWEYVKTMKDAILQREDANVIIIDWRRGASNLILTNSISNARAVAARVAKILQNLLRLPNGDSKRMWCVGFSSGCHLCGYLGMAMPADQKLGRVTGLSPAGPGVEDNPDVRIGLNPSAAQFVDVHHTDVLHLFGTKRRLGHLDVYYTGHQFSINLSLKSLLNLQPVCEGLCQHRRSIDFFTSSLKQPKECFATSSHCASENDIPGSCRSDMTCYAYGGYFADQSCVRTGIVHVKVSGSEPYCVS